VSVAAKTVITLGCFGSFGENCYLVTAASDSSWIWHYRALDRLK